MSKVASLPVHKPIHLRNATCIYCGGAFGDTPQTRKTREHVIGRRFVPRGTLDRQWNLIVNACAACNNAKADLENDLSAILMQPDAWGRHVGDDPRLHVDGRNKGEKAHSRKTRKLVKDSHESLVINVPFGPAIFTFNFTAPPQADSERVMQLARYHVGAFFYFITYDETKQRGGFIQGLFAVVAEVRRSDWGNARLSGFMQRVQSWDLRFLGHGADGCFCVMIRRRADGAPIWAWAVEWNQSHRVAGFFGDEALVRDEASQLPVLDSGVVAEGPNSWIRHRVEVSLSAEEDTLFDEDVPAEPA